MVWYGMVWYGMVCMYVGMYACTYVRTYVCACMCMHGCMYAWMYVCMHGCMYDAWMYVCMHGCLFILYIYISVCVRIIEGDLFCHPKSISKHLAERHEDFFVHVIFVTVGHGVNCFDLKIIILFGCQNCIETMFGTFRKVTQVSFRKVGPDAAKNVITSCNGLACLTFNTDMFVRLHEETHGIPGLWW